MTGKKLESMAARVGLGSAAVLAVALFSACECAEGEDEICNNGDCICGPTCVVGGAACLDGRVCAEYAYAPGEGVCVPDGWHGTTGGGGGGDTCPSGQILVQFPDGSSQCMIECTDDSQCSVCCGHLSNGSGACAPSEDYCGGFPPPPDPEGCHDMTSCLSVDAGSEYGTGCVDESSLHVTLVIHNNCATTVTIRECIRRTDGALCGVAEIPGGGSTTWDCCEATGEYFVAGNDPIDFGTGCIPNAPW
jgi:hypothetical protein